MEPTTTTPTTGPVPTQLQRALAEVHEQAAFLANGRGQGDLLRAVLAYGEACRRDAEAGASVDASDVDEGITRERWCRDVERVMLAFGDSEEDAAEIASHLWEEQDHLSGEIGDPLEEALLFLEERPDSDERRDAKRYRAIRGLDWTVNYDHTSHPEPDSIEINIACAGDRAASPADSGAELDRIADAALEAEEQSEMHA